MPNRMTELELFVSITLEQGGEWWKLEETENYSLHESKTSFMLKERMFYNSPVFQIFDRKGKRIFASTNYNTAYQKYKNLCESGLEK